VCETVNTSAAKNPGIIRWPKIINILKALRRTCGVSLMARPARGGRTTCEACISIDVRRWHREGRLRAGQYFSCLWTRGGEPSGKINVRSECDAVVLIYRSQIRGASQWKSIEQRIPITWDGLPSRRSTALVRLFGLSQRPILRAPRRSAVRRRRALCLPPMLRVGLRKPAGNAHAARRVQSAKD